MATTQQKKHNGREYTYGQCGHDDDKASRVLALRDYLIGGFVIRKVAC